MANEQRRRGFCPRVWTPMESGDGLLVRVHAATRWFEARQIEQLAQLAREHGNGLMEVTRRANLQLRGVRPGSLSALQRGLVALGFAADSPEGERRFALHATPWLGLDPACAALAPLLDQLERLLDVPQGDTAIHPKLAITLSGPRDELGALGADLAVALDPHKPAHARLLVALAPGARHELGLCALDEVAAWVAGWLERLAEAPAAAAADWQGQRMHTWIARHGLDALARHAPPSLVPAQAANAPLPRTHAADAAAWLGFHADHTPWFGVLLPFGAGDPAQWSALTALCAHHGDGNLRTHPGRGLLLRGVRADRAEELAAALAQGGVCVRPDQPLTRVVACAGAPACGSAHGETRQLARGLAELVRDRLVRGASLHVSGCEKSCARSGAAELVVVHGPDGAHLAFDRSAAEAAHTPARTLAQLRAALSANNAECATSAPYLAPEPDVP
ncbi:MAG TPA: hypothetical protein VFZ61_07675 [Polyangiales bacterium]